MMMVEVVFVECKKSSSRRLTMLEVVFIEVLFRHSYLLRRSVGKVVFTGWLVCRSGEVVFVAHQNV